MVNGQNLRMKKRSPQEVASRAIVLNCVVAASFDVPRKSLIQWLETEGLWSSVSPWESDYLQAKRPRKKDNIDANQSAEAAATLVWSLGLIPELPHASGPTDLELIIKALPQIESSTALFVKNAKLRPESEINAFNNSIYELHWSVRDAYINGREPPDGLHPVVVYQRHWAANWLCPEIVGDLPWDDVTTDT
jgi:hypothetical protein